MLKKPKKQLIFLSVYLFICLFILPNFIAVTKVIGTSMYPTYKDKQFVIASKHYKEIKRGDVVIAKSLRNSHNQIIKRVIAVPGDRIQILHKEVYVNNKKVSEPYMVWEKESVADQNFERPLTLSEDEYFIMGDNRDNSFDSRMGGPIKEKNILAKVVSKK